MQQTSLPAGRPSHYVLALALSLFLASPQTAYATAIANGFPGPNAGFRLTEGGLSGMPADGLQITHTVLTASSSIFTSGAGNVAVADLAPVNTDGLSRLAIGATMDVIASASGEAFAQVSYVVVATVLNTFDDINVFDLIAFFGINTSITVDDLSRESVFATWNVDVSAPDRIPSRIIGEGPRTINCDLATFTPHACPELYGDGEGNFGRILLAPGDSFDLVLNTHMTLHAIVRPSEVPEPTSLALLSASCIALAAWRRSRSAWRQGGISIVKAATSTARS